ncbi:MAG: response regulator [Armatimonadetes bacterium]|nr:response regulator [Armatimonadota bacterium]
MLLHRHLKRQLDRLGLADPDRPPQLEQWLAFLFEISGVYEGWDLQHLKLDRALHFREKELEDVYRELAAERYKLNSLLSCLDLALCALDGDGRPLFLSARAEQLLGWSETELAESRLLEVLLDGQSPWERISGGRSFSDEGREFLTRDGERLPVAFRLYPILRGGALTGAVLTFIPREDAALPAAESIPASSGEKAPVDPVDRLAAAVSVFLAQPMPESAPHELRSLYDSAESMERILGELRQPSPRPPLPPADVDLRGLLEQVCRRRLREARLRGLDIVPFVDPSLPARVRLQLPRPEPWLERLVGEILEQGGTGERVILLTQAVGGRQARVEIELARPLSEERHRADLEAAGGQWTVEQREGRYRHVLVLPFEPLEPAPATPAELKGHRAALAISGRAQRAVLSRYLEHLGLVVQEAGNDVARLRGTSFLIATPDRRELLEAVRNQSNLYGVEALALLEPGEVLPGPPWDGALEKPVAWVRLIHELAARLSVSEPTVEAEPEALRVLIVEDEPVTRMMVEQCIKDLGHEAMVTEDAEQAWDLFQQQPVDVVVSDWVMPGMHGPDLCARIRASEKDRHIYFILLTGKRDDPRIAAALEKSGVDDYLVKPLNPEELESRLQLASERRRLASQRSVLRRSG